MKSLKRSQSLFYWIIYSYTWDSCSSYIYIFRSLNPYFTGLSILITTDIIKMETEPWRSQSLFYWIIYSYLFHLFPFLFLHLPSQSLFYWIIYSYYYTEDLFTDPSIRLNPYFTGLSILIRLLLFN